MNISVLEIVDKTLRRSKHRRFVWSGYNGQKKEWEGGIIWAVDEQAAIIALERTHSEVSMVGTNVDLYSVEERDRIVY